MPASVPAQTGGWIGGMLFLIVALLALHIILIWWVYVDAQQNSDHPPFLWALVIFFAPLLGLILYLLLGRTASAGTTARSRDDGPARYTHECENCGKRYHSPATDEIPTCHRCGGINVRATG